MEWMREEAPILDERQTNLGIAGSIGLYYYSEADNIAYSLAYKSHLIPFCGS